MTLLPRGRTLAAAAALLLLAALPALSAAKSPAPCAISTLQVSFNLVPDSPGAGNVVYRLGVTNMGSAAPTCVLGRRTFTLLGKNGTALPTHATGNNAPFTLPANSAVATAFARFSPDVAGTGDRQSGACEPTAYKLRVAFAGSGSVTVPIRPPTPVCERGTFSMSAFAALGLF